MIEKLLEKKRKLWYERNCLNDELLEYISLLCKRKKIQSWKEIINNGSLDLLIVHSGKNYKVKVDEFKMGLILLERNSVNNVKSKEFYHLVKTAGEDGIFYGSDGWFELIEWISKRNKKENKNVGNF